MAIVVDVVIAAAKFFVAALTGRSTMLTEGVNSLVDMGNEFLLLDGSLPADAKHPSRWAFTSPPTPVCTHAPLILVMPSFRPCSPAVSNITVKDMEKGSRCFRRLAAWTA